ncbi:MAG: hypothetical protein ACI4UA_00880, partial [Bacteroidaceae bacterium]
FSSPEPASDTTQDAADNHDEIPYKEAESEPWLSYKVGDGVTHKSFGRGTITSLDDKYIWISFGTNKKKFLFPQCFQKGFFDVEG